MHEQNPELLAAITERIKLGYSDKQIHSELRVAGYDDETIDRVVLAARQDVHPLPPPQLQKTLITPGQLLVDAAIMCRSEYRTFLSGLRDLLLLFGLGGILLFGFFMVSSVEVPALEDFDVSLLETYAWVLVAVYVILVLLGFLSRVILFAMQRALLLRKQPDVSYLQNVQWAVRNIIAIAWVFILVGLSIQAGYALLVIPGIALTIYVLYSNYLLALGQARGVGALLASIELVYGRWWAVCGRLLLIGFVSVFGVSVMAGVVAAILFAFSETAPLVTIIGMIVLFVAALWALVAYTTAAHICLFESLEQTKTARLSTDQRNTLQTFLIIAAVVGLLLAISGGVNNTSNSLTELQSLQTQQNSTAFLVVATELTTVRSQAALYYETSGKSYEGVCSEIASTIVTGKNPDCVDRSDRWALSVETAAGERLCVQAAASGVARGGVQAANATCIGETQEIESLMEAENRALKDRAQELRELW